MLGYSVDTVDLKQRTKKQNRTGLNDLTLPLTITLRRPSSPQSLSETLVPLFGGACRATLSLPQSGPSNVSWLFQPAIAEGVSGLYYVAQHSTTRVITTPYLLTGPPKDKIVDANDTMLPILSKHTAACCAIDYHLRRSEILQTEFVFIVCCGSSCGDKSIKCGSKSCQRCPSAITRLLEGLISTK
ncbi:hypothetical protein GJ744_004782 [Endocarpon pusillum]|uniref:Uncharacterized protein n=1 Tax=Endocarpon pusillum TaxID=364733 RepID=A0A8H7A5I9_9EURO|nr:hypothetical protein GJ744_004782 [Endocarpon pusillum]